MTAQRYHALKVRAVTEETHDARSVVFEVPLAAADTSRPDPALLELYSKVANYVAVALVVGVVTASIWRSTKQAKAMT